MNNDNNGHDPIDKFAPHGGYNTTGFLPKVVSEKNSAQPLYQDIDQALANNLDKEGLCRLRAVEETVKFFSTRQMANGVQEQKNFQQTFEDIYQFLIKQNNDNK